MSATMIAAPVEATADERFHWEVLVVVMIGTVMSALDISIVNVSLPNMMSTFGAGVDAIEWVVTGYMLAFSTFMPLTAWLRDRLGSRVLYMACLAIFTIGSVLCALAPNLPMLVLARVLQAVGGGALTPTGMAMIAEVFPPAERGRAFGIWGIGVIAGPAFGPPLGGYLTQVFGWRSIFDINLPIGIIGLIMASRILRRDRPHPSTFRGFDLPGFLLLTTFLISALLGISNGNEHGWTSPFVLSCGALSVVALALFLTVESIVTDRILDLGLFRNVQFTVAMVVTASRSVALYGGLFLLPLFLRNQMGRSEIETGLLLLPGALVIGVVMPLAAQAADKFGARLPTLVGLVMTAWFMWMYRTLDPTTSYWNVLFPTLIRGIGIGLLVTPVMTVGLNAVPTHKAGMASSMLALIQQIAGSLGIAVLASVLGHRASFHMGVVGEGMEATRPAFLEATHAIAARALSLGVAPMDAGLTGSALVARHVAQGAQVLAFNDAFLVGGAVVLLGIVPALFLDATPRPRKPNAEPRPEMLE
ncbi:MAG: DHA2 family efflux MFS transporter permease subunit [bacterium]